ncbi:MAG TPA: hypothetical protein VMX55_07780 [candidate division Zixibacteria bacterium]|nr:hypothetical protein [candidate division Zixibacteria bacterium]
MTSRKNKVVIIFSMMLIAMNLFAVTQAIATNTNFFDGENYLPSSNVDVMEEYLPSNPVIAAEDEIPNLNNWDLSINVTRKIQVHDYGLLTVNDTFYVINNDNVTLPLFRFAIPNYLVDQMGELYGGAIREDLDASYNRTEIAIELRSDNFTFYKMELTPPVTNSSRYKINIFQVFIHPYENFFYVDESSNPYNGVKMNISGVPFITKKIQQCDTQFIKPEEGGLVNSLFYPSDPSFGEASAIFNPFYNVNVFNFTKIYDSSSVDYVYRIQFGCWMKNEAPSQIALYKRTITLDNWYYAKIHEEFTIEGTGVRPDENIYDLSDPRIYATFALQRFHLSIDNAENAKVYDEYGSLPPPKGAAEINQLNQINVYLRIPVYGGDTAQISVDYLLKFEDILEFEKSEYILKTLAMPICDFYIEELQLEIVFPQGANYQYLYYANNAIHVEPTNQLVFLNIGTRQVIKMNAYSITPYDNLDLKIGYFMNDLAYFIQPLIFSMIVFLACLLYVGLRILRKDVIEKVVILPEEKEEVPIELIQDFVEKYEEKTALQTRISKLDDDRRKKKIKAKEYDQQRKILESKMRDTIKTLDTTKRSLKEKGRKFSSVIQKIEVNEEKRLSVERSIQDLRIRYIREKAISKDAYLRILRDYQNQIDKFERDIDKEIINLRLLIEHESKES